MGLQKYFPTYLLMISIFSLPLVSTAHSYQLSARAVRQGSAAGSSATYHLRGTVSHHDAGRPAGTSLTLGEGFLRSAYFSGRVILAPIVILITPNTAVNTGPVEITNLGGANFLPGAAVRLSRSGQSDINAANVVVVNAGQIACTFDLAGAAGGDWDVTVTNTDGRSGSLPRAFKVTYAAPTVTA